MAQRLGVWCIAEDHPEAPAILASPSGSRSFGELVGQAHRIVHALRAAGLRRGDAVAVLLPNDLHIVEWSLACEESGFYFVMLNPHLSAKEIAGVLDASGAAVLVGHELHAAAMSELVGNPGLLAILAIGEIPGVMSVEEFLAPHPTTLPDDRSPGQQFSFSSGTTGRPKGVRRSLPEGDPSQRANEAAIFGRAFGFAPRIGCHLVSAGMHHGGCRTFYIGALNIGQALVILPKFDAESVLRVIQEHRVTTAYMVPTMFHRLLQLPEETRARHDLSSLEVVAHSAAPCPRVIKQRMMDWWGPVIWETYGGMEGAATIAKPHRWLEKPGTVGRSVRGVTVRILDEDGNALPPDRVGQVYIDMGSRSFEYTGARSETEKIFSGTGFTIGDMGYLDEDGYLFISDRAKDMIITGGVNVYPAEVEAVLVEHSAVADVAVIGIPDDEWGEQVKAVVELAAGAIQDAERETLGRELIAFCRERLASYKCPRSVDFRDALPRSDTGKLFKRRLRDEYWAGAGRHV
ncbi:MAG: AMP-binding protein [Myxococcota bacterium]|nr:AMP-binding protein [Myxococcota bacterium]MEE2673970.1 AMP-binding protein [Myxococcota bacterium]